MKIKMKKVLCALFAIILVCAGLSACEKSPCYAKITYSDGSSEMLDMKKFKDLHYQNKYAFDEKYSGNKIEAVDRNNKLIKVQYFIKSPSITAMPMTKANLETDGWDLVESGTINKYTLEGNMVELASAEAAGIYGMYVSYEPKK